MTTVVTPATGFHEGYFAVGDDDVVYLDTDAGAIPLSTTASTTVTLTRIGSDWLSYFNSQTWFVPPASPITVGNYGFEGSVRGAYHGESANMYIGIGCGLGRASYGVTTLDFLAGSLDSRITFTRASSATRVNSSGLIESVSSNVARFDYDPVTLACKGLLIEEARTNLCLYSDDLTNAAWTKSNATTAKTATGPDGVSNSATTLTATAGNATALQAITSASAARVTSCYIKRRTGTGTVEMTQDNGTTWAAVTVTSSWTRVSIAAATLANPTVGLRIVTSGDAVDVALFDHEVGSFITSAIPTTSATVTRAADVASMTGTNFSSWFNATQGTFVVEGSSNGINTSTGQATLFSVHDGTTSNRMRGKYGSLTNPAFEGANGGASTWDVLGTGVSGATNKLACAYAANDIAISLNGAAVSTDASATIPTVDRLTIGGFLTARELNGHIRRLSYYPTRLNNAQLQAITA